MTDSPTPSPWPAPWTAPRIAEFLARAFIHPEQVVELRALNVGRPGRTVAGYFDGRRLLDLARSALALTRQASAVFFTPNPVDPALLPRCPNRTDIVSRDKFALAKDGDFLERRYLFADVDPVRQHGRADDPVDEDEYWDGVVCSWIVRDRLTAPTGGGWPPPLEMFSGNGVHSLFPLARPLPPQHGGDGDDPLRACLAMWADRLTFEGRAKLDPNTWNACRLLKVPGTRVAKGAESPTRPYRTADVLRIPDDWPEPRRPDDRRPRSEPVPEAQRGDGDGRPARVAPLPAPGDAGGETRGGPGGKSAGAGAADGAARRGSALDRPKGRRPGGSRAEGPGLFE